MCNIDGEMAEVSVIKDPIARKSHGCSDCGREIMPGERYRRTFMIFEGRPFDYKTCSHCMVGISWLSNNCGTYALGYLSEDMTDHAREYPSLAFGLLRIAVGMRRKWRAFDGDKLMPIPPAPRAIEEAA